MATGTLNVSENVTQMIQNHTTLNPNLDHRQMQASHLSRTTWQPLERGSNGTNGLHNEVNSKDTTQVTKIDRD